MNVRTSGNTTAVDQPDDHRLVRYTADCFDRLRVFAGQLDHEVSLVHKPFVDHYYTNNQWCDLYLLLDKAETIVGTVGIERMPFVINDRAFTLGNGSNFFVLSKGIGHGKRLFTKWLECCDCGVVFGGTEDTLRILRKQQWDFFTGARVYHLNESVKAHSDEPGWRTAARKLRALATRTNIVARTERLPAIERLKLSAVAEREYSDEMQNFESSFDLRFVPSKDYLAWRYGAGLSFSRYRIFSLRIGGDQVVGLVILNETADSITVSHCDGIDPEIVAYGVLLSLSAVAREKRKNFHVRLAACHGEMLSIYTAFGFRPSFADRPLAIGALGNPPNIVADTSKWLINFDWGDNCLRVPFLDQ
jgi:hypothetical protein